MEKIYLATKNPGKFIELKELLQTPNVEFISIMDLGIPDIEEIGETFIQNAVIKAETISKITNCPAIADDSGLEIDVLNGFPGINSARCAGENATDDEKMEFVLNKMLGIANRKANFICAMAFVRPFYPDTWFVGKCYGTILEEPKGIAKPGLQYDRIFFDDKLNKTFAELTNEEKNEISHRGIACRQMKKFLEMIYINKIK